ncbi:broad substrate specificity ATP-binding cassette transporter ABCG2-like [Protopterus annectens]|uniref:broad substrate specificity ATP-binding cassette transporter ABCG2-like n=1 Tax=Protopterus annectens TaxID=7888 RepID=UPI001CFA9E91|nr:broad substrate specificity ATP-binding cassette transporter ABCG2-like [Protopterus annectens]
MNINMDLELQRSEQTSYLNISGPTLTFQNVQYVVSVKGKSLLHKKEEKAILHDVSGIMKPGMNAILGPTGSGKTSLLDVIAGRNNPDGLKNGQVLVDGELVTSSFCLRSAYVVQQDALMGTLTVRENLQFSASLRLSSQQYSSEEKQMQVNSVVRELGLQDCADTKIGTDFIRGVSGGERKRCSIGMELIISPSLLFLDEPTTGLDANTANSIMHLLYTLSRNGRTVIFSIHQPRYSIFRLFDNLVLLNKGEVVYAGPAGEATSYFEGIGFKCEAFNNPPDFFLDVMSGEVSQSNSDHVLCLDVDNTSDKNPLAFYYRRSHYYDQLEEELKQLAGTTKVTEVATARKMSYATSFVHQLCVVCQRTVLNILRNPQTSVAQLFLCIFFAVLVGLIYYQIPDTLPEALQNRVGAFFFLVINQVFGNLSAVELFINERVLFIHENSSGYYRTSVYFLSKVFADLIPNRIIPMMVFSGISYFMMGLKANAESFFLYAITLSLTSLAAVSMAFLVSASVSTFSLANVLIALPYVFMMVFGGFLVNLNAMLDWLSWIKWISIFRYGMNALTVIELKDQIFYSNGSPFPANEYMKEQGIDYSTWGLWQNEVALLAMMIIFLFMAYIQLRRIKKWK